MSSKKILIDDQEISLDDLFQPSKELQEERKRLIQIATKTKRS